MAVLRVNRGMTQKPDQIPNPSEGYGRRIWLSSREIVVALALTLAAAAFLFAAIIGESGRDGKSPVASAEQGRTK